MGESNSIRSRQNRQLGYTKRPVDPRGRLPAAPRLRLGHAPNAETISDLLIAASYINPRAFRDARPGMLTPLEVRSMRAGILEPRDVTGERPAASDKRAERRRQAREVFLARVAFTRANPHPATGRASLRTTDPRARARWASEYLKAGPEASE